MEPINPKGIKKGTKIEIRKDCKQCGKPILNSRYRTFCGDRCRVKFYNKQKAAENSIKHREDRDKESFYPAPGKEQCHICGHWYSQVGCHVHQRHGLKVKEYREKYGIEKKGRKSGQTEDMPTLTPPSSEL